MTLHTAHVEDTSTRIEQGELGMALYPPLSLLRKSSGISCLTRLGLIPGMEYVGTADRDAMLMKRFTFSKALSGFLYALPTTRIP